MSFLISASHPTRTSSDTNRLWRFDDPTGPALLCLRPHMYILPSCHRHRRIWHDMSALNITRAKQLLYGRTWWGRVTSRLTLSRGRVGEWQLFVRRSVSDWRRLQLIICWPTFTVLLCMQWENRGVIDREVTRKLFITACWNFLDDIKLFFFSAASPFGSILNIQMVKWPVKCLESADKPL